MLVKANSKRWNERTILKKLKSSLKSWQTFNITNYKKSRKMSKQNRTKIVKGFQL
jgi:hypothetical protein